MNIQRVRCDRDKLPYKPSMMYSDAVAWDHKGLIGYITKDYIKEAAERYERQKLSVNIERRPQQVEFIWDQTISSLDSSPDSRDNTPDNDSED